MKKIFSICLLLLLSVCIYAPYTIQSEGVLEESEVISIENIEEDLDENILDMKEVIDSSDLTQLGAGNAIRTSSNILTVFFIGAIVSVIIGLFIGSSIEEKRLRLKIPKEIDLCVILELFFWMLIGLFISFFFINGNYVIGVSGDSEYNLTISRDVFSYDGRTVITDAGDNLEYIVIDNEVSNKIEVEYGLGVTTVTVPEYLNVED